MSDDSTRSGSGDGLKKGATQVATRRIQVRLGSGKIFGPYQRTEILGFISVKKLTGDEHILFEGLGGDWKPITSDPEFFDALQSAIFGTTSAPVKSSVASAEENPPVVPPPKSPSPKKSTAPGEKLELELPTYDYESPAPRTIPTVTPIPSSTVPPPPPSTPPPAKAGGKRPLLLAIVALGLFAVWFSTKDGGGLNQVRPLFRDPHSSLAYSRLLTTQLQTLKDPAPLMPEKLTPAANFPLVRGLGAHFWIADLKLLLNEENFEARSSAAYWGRWAWDLMWLGSVVEIFDSSYGAQLRKRGEEILSELRDRKLVPPTEEALFSALPDFTTGKWSQVVQKLRGLDNDELAQWLAEEASWWDFWERGGTGEKPIFLRDGYVSFDLDLASRVRQGLVNRDRDFLDRLEELAGQDAGSNLLWFSAAEYFWRIISDQVQRSNGRFTMGLTTLSLLPRPCHVVYWKQYTEFLSTFGRQSTAQRAAANLALVEKGPLEGNAEKSWWDFGQEGLDVARIVQEILQKGASGPLAESDIAGLQVLGFVIPEGADALTAAGLHLAFEEEWSRSIPMFEGALKVKPDHVPALGGLIWAYSALYRFDKAQETYDRLTKIQTETPEALKYNAVLHAYGRDFDEAGTDLIQYTKTVPNDGWGHFFRALMELSREKNFECAKAANLAALNATGELKFRSTLLYYKCRVLAKVGISESLSEMKAMLAKNTRSVPVILTLTKAYLDADLVGEALQSTEEALRRMPSNYRLRLRMGEVYEYKHDYDKAVAFYSRAASERKDSAEAWIRIARVYELQERPLDAATNYDTASRLDPDYPQIWLMGARAYAKGGKFREAAELYIKEVEERPAVISSFVEAAEFMLKNNAPQIVPQIFQKYASNYESEPRALVRVAQAYLAMRQYDNARVTASAAMARDPNHPEPYRILAIVSEAQGVYETAKQRYERFLQLAPRAPEADQIRMKLANPPYSQ